MRTFTSIILLALLTPAAHGSDALYTGTWKMNPAKSDFNDYTVEFSEGADGSIKVARSGESYMVRTDAKDYPTPWGGTESWKRLGDRRWEMTLKSGDTITLRAIRELSADGKTLASYITRIDANGDTSKEEFIYERVSGEGANLSGEWKVRSASMESPRSVSISEDASGAVTLKNINDNATCTAKTEGSDYPARGQIWPEGWTCAVTRTEPKSIKVTWKKDGEVMVQEAISASNDGKYLTIVSTAPGTKEKIKAVFDRQ